MSPDQAHNARRPRHGLARRERTRRAAVGTGIVAVGAPAAGWATAAFVPPTLLYVKVSARRAETNRVRAVVGLLAVMIEDLGQTIDETRGRSLRPLRWSPWAVYVLPTISLALALLIA